MKEYKIVKVEVNVRPEGTSILGDYAKDGWQILIAYPLDVGLFLLERDVLEWTYNMNDEDNKVPRYKL